MVIVRDNVDIVKDMDNVDIDIHNYNGYSYRYILCIGAYI